MNGAGLLEPIYLWITDLEGVLNDKLASDAYLGSKSHPLSKIKRKKKKTLWFNIFLVKKSF